MATEDGEAYARPELTIDAANHEARLLSVDKAIATQKRALEQSVYPMIDDLVHLTDRERHALRNYLGQMWDPQKLDIPYAYFLMPRYLSFLPILISMATPAILLTWASTSRSGLEYAFVYVASFVLGESLGFLLSWLQRRLLARASPSISSQIAWAFEEAQMPSRSMRASKIGRQRTWSRGVYTPYVGAAIIWTPIALVKLRDPSLSLWLELVLIASLIPVGGMAYSVLTAVIYTRVAGSIRSDFSMPYAQLVLELLNLAYYAQHCQRRFQAGHQKHLLLRLDRVANGIEQQLRGRFRRVLRPDPETSNQVARHARAVAAAIRAHKFAVVVATGPEDMDRVVQSLCSGLIAAVTGDHKELTAKDYNESHASRWERMIRPLIPAMLIALAAIFVPLIPGFASSKDVQDSLRLSLAIPAVLSLLVASTPGSEKAAVAIQDAVAKYVPGLPGGRS